MQKKALFHSLFGRKVKRLWSYFLHHVFVGVFQYVPGPQKHVLHLVWSDSDISRDINIAFKLARLKICFSQ